MAYIHAESEEVVGPFHLQLVWTIKKEDLTKSALILPLKTQIPGSVLMQPHIKYGYIKICLQNSLINFITCWPKDIKIGKIDVEAGYSLKTNDGKTSVDLRATINQKMKQTDPLKNKINMICCEKLNYELLLEQDNSFKFQANIRVEIRKKEKQDMKQIKRFKKDIKSIFHDENNSDVLVVAEEKEFKCHKNILSARSEVFENMLAHNTLESQSNTIIMKDISADAAKYMLKYIYSGEIPKKLKHRCIELLHAADMYQLDFLKDACVKMLIENLDVRSCISTFIMVDRYIPHVESVREDVIMFMKCKAVELVDLESWDKMMETYPSLTKEIVKAIAKGSKEKHLCRFCIVENKKRKIIFVD